MITTEQFIRACVAKFIARRGQRTVFAGGRRMVVHTPGERILYLPNGHHVNVATDDSGVATQVEEDDALHAVARPAPIRLHIPGRNQP